MDYSKLQREQIRKLINEQREAELVKIKGELSGEDLTDNQNDSFCLIDHYLRNKIEIIGIIEDKAKKYFGHIVSGKFEHEIYTVEYELHINRDRDGEFESLDWDSGMFHITIDTEI